jgi:hypothetical protein
MACEFTPKRIRIDPELRKEFPPCTLAGLDQSLAWNTYERILEFTRQFMQNEEHWRRCGLSQDAKWMREVIQQITGVRLDQSLQDFLDSRPPSV